MRRGNLIRRYEILVAAACVAAHANVRVDGFRQRDIRFLLDLFTNWLGHCLEMEGATIANTQISRYVQQLVVDGYARVIEPGSYPRYRLSRIGIIELLTRIVPGSGYLQPEQCVFVYYFIKNYRQRLIDAIEQEGRQFPPALRMEIMALLDVRSVLTSQLRAAELEFIKLEQRLRDSENSARLAQRLFIQGNSTAEVAQEIEKAHPYELNSMKPLAELMSEIPPDLARWELETGAQRRATDLWSPIRSMLATHLVWLRGVLDTLQ